MSPFARFRRPQPLLTSALLVAVLVRALIPAGFMPSSERPFTLQICPSGLPASVFAGLYAGRSAHAHHHAGMPGRDSGARATLNTHGSHEIDRHQGAAALEECSFGAASAGAALVGQGAQLALPSLDTYLTIVPFPPPAPLETQRFGQHHPRAPPVFS